MKCPAGHEGVGLTTPDYGYGYGAEFVCYQCDPYGRRFASKTAEARALSDAARGRSAANAAVLAARVGGAP